MKTALLAACLLYACALAGSPQAEDFRIVDGILYNTKLSVNWTLIGGGHDLVVEAVLTNGIVVQERWKEEVRGAPDVDPLTRNGFFSGGGSSYRPLLYTIPHVGEERLIKNVPAKMVNGDTLTPRLMIRVGEATWQGKTLAVYDCGLPNTLENRKTLKPKP